MIIHDDVNFPAHTFEVPLLVKFILPLLLIITTSSCTCANAQLDSLSCEQKKKITLTATALTATTGYILLNELWYKNYPRSSMHAFNDNGEWLQVDKVGHAFSSYTLSNQLKSLYTWSCAPQKSIPYYCAVTSLVFMSSIEILDGRSAQWGFSWGDMMANTTGSLLFFSQEKIWEEQRIMLKFSYTPSTFASVNSELLGRNFQQRLMKDYNAQTYWASFNVHSFLASGADFPRWLNIAIGYGATKMITAKNAADDVNNFQREREFYFSFDADLERVRWKKKWMQRTAKVLSFIKIPGPTLEIRENGNLKIHGLFF